MEKPNLEKLLNLLCEKIGEKTNKPVIISNRLKEDLNLDSLDIVELVMECEDDFDITIADAETAQIQTVEDLGKVINNKLR